MFFKSKNKEEPPKNSDVLKALSTVIDPDQKRDIVSLGSVKKMELHGDHVHVAVEVSHPGGQERVKAECQQKLEAIPGIKHADIQMTVKPKPATQSQASNRIALPTVKNVIAVASGKGGVGKSTVTINLATALADTGAKVGVLDADIYGPSIPLMTGLKERPPMNGDRVVPLERGGLKIMSMGFLVPEDQPVIWRGPMVHGALTQFLSQVEWGELDYLLIDMPPGTGDAQLTISQTAPLSGAVIVTTPQDVSLLDARRGTLMFRNVNIPILGVIENMAGFTCGHCGEMTPIFRAGGGDKIARELGIPLLGSIPLDPNIAEGGDFGKPTVHDKPNLQVSKAFAKIAGDIALQLSSLNAKGSGPFKPLSLEWQ